MTENKMEHRFGVLPDGREVTACLLKSDGAEVTVLTLGGILQSFIVDGTDIVAGFDTVEDYLHDDSYQGATVGRTCNRIRGGRYEWKGEEVILVKNEGDKQLHGGREGWNRKLWSIEKHTDDELVLTLHSPDGDQGFPGNAEVKTTFRLDGTALVIDYEAVTDRDTPVSMTCHAYFNLLGYGNGDILGHFLRVDADSHTEVDGDLLPTGRRIPVEGSCFDFRTGKAIGASWPENFGGFDDNFVLNASVKRSILGQNLHYAATLAAGGKELTVYTDRPCMQVYIGNFLNGKIPMKGGHPQQVHCTCCLETQTEPDLALRRGEIMLTPGETYHARTAYIVSKN